jgi:drug/metabolite transporter (DMT)-like permease
VLSFGLNFWLIYISETYLTSGIIAVIFSLIIFFNLINGRIFLKRPIEKNTILGGLVGLVGLFILFYPELSKASSQSYALTGFLIALTAVFSASLGNMAATKSGLAGNSVWRINAWATLYGAAALSMIAMFTGTPFTYELTKEYTFSLIYLSVFGTILAFGAYIKLMVLIGPEKASYGALIIPFVAISLSTIFEGYQWTTMAVAGFGLAILGNYLVMKKVS